MVTLTKRDIARAHVEEAIRLHLNDNALCAITLAGAAEAVLEGLVLDAGGTPVVDASVATIEKLRARGLNVMGKKSPKDMLSAWNLARNKLKHHDDGDAEALTMNVVDESYWMIRRALENAKAIGLAVSNAAEFDNWVIINVTMGDEQDWT